MPLSPYEDCHGYSATAQQKVGGVIDRSIEYQYMLCILGASLLGEVLVIMPIKWLHTLVRRVVPMVEEWQYTGTSRGTNTCTMHKRKAEPYCNSSNSSNSGS
jgi:hypothetical protein